MAAGRSHDRDLVARIAVGHDDALQQAYAEHADAVFRLATIACGATTAEEVTQDVFLRLWRRPAAFDATRGTLRTYLLTQAHHRAVDRTRSDTSRRFREQQDADLPAAAPPGPEDDAIAAETNRHLDRLVADLPAATAEAIVLAFGQGLTYRQVAARLHQPEGTVKSRIRAGLLRLREQLGTEASTPPGVPTATGRAEGR